MTQSMESNSEKETWEIGNRIAQQCEAGTIVLLHGDLGVGKTVFTKPAQFSPPNKILYWERGKSYKPAK